MTDHILTFLSLGDSYTIGECVNLYESFPYQTISLLRKNGLLFAAPEIIAKTGWTTDELETQLNHSTLLPSYNIITLLIGVNNQYRERSLDEYYIHFEKLLKRAIELASNNAQSIYVLSIPDWSCTPFGIECGRQNISGQIDNFNSINNNLSRNYSVNYIEITNGNRLRAKNGEQVVAADGLHPNAYEYSQWAAPLVALIEKNLNLR
jgi:lysophospholipase L1-like esterase